MLMQPSSPDPKFDFMLKNNAQPKRRMALPRMSKPIKIVAGAIVAVILLVIVSSVLSGHKGGATKDITGALARGQETLRVTQLAQQQLKFQDPTTQALSATVYSSLSSDQQQLIAYLAKSHTKVSKLQLAADTDKSTDASLQTASQNNALDSSYITYLRDSLTKYQADLQAAYNAAGPNGKVILKSAFDSANTLLSNPPLKS
jgi:hypothetical protein